MAVFLLGQAACYAAPDVIPVPVNSDNPYEAIAIRNAFGLRNPPVPVDPKDNIKVEPPKLKLQGITTILGRKQVVLKALAKPPGQPTDVSYVLEEGMGKNDIEVTTIDEKTGTVNLKLAGNPLTLTIKDDADKPAAGGAAPGLPALPTAPGLPGLPPPPQPGAQPAPAAAGNNGGVTTFGGNNSSQYVRPLRGGTTSGNGSGGYGMAPQGNTSTTAGSLEAVQTAAQRSPEQNVLLYEANRARNKSAEEAGLRPRLPVHPAVQDR